MPSWCLASLTRQMAWCLASPRVLNHFAVITMKRLDQGHLHSKPEVPRLCCLDWESNPASVVGGEHSGKEPFEQLSNSYLEHLHISPPQFLLFSETKVLALLPRPSSFSCKNTKLSTLYEEKCHLKKFSIEGVEFFKWQKSCWDWDLTTKSCHLAEKME